MCDEMEQAHISVPLSFLCYLNFLCLHSFLFQCQPGLKAFAVKLDSYIHNISCINRRSGFTEIANTRMFPVEGKRWGEGGVGWIRWGEQVMKKGYKYVPSPLPMLKLESLHRKLPSYAFQEIKTCSIYQL